MSKVREGKATGSTAIEAVVPIRIPGELLERTDVLGRRILADPETSFLLGRMGGKVSRSAVLRLALLEGLKALEARYASG
jgi:hypothetical protein